jgi:hypothetical protein
MVSADCEQRAVCAEDAASTSEATTPDEIDGSAVAQEEVDLSTETDVVSESVATNGDAGQLDGNVGPRDVMSEDVATEPPPPPDGSCNAPYTCAPRVPNGWSGPALVWTAPSGEQPPACPTDYKSIDLGASLTGGSADTCGCTCVPSNESCVVTMTFHPDTQCNSQCFVSDGGVAAISVTPLPDGGCTQVPSNLCGSGGAASTTDPSYSATCTPQATKTPGSAPAWMTSARLCSWTVDAGGRCNVPDAGCIVGPTTGFGPAACIFQLGDMLTCPTAYPNSRGVFFELTDTRDCSPCTCNGPDGGTCSGEIAAYGDNACAGLAWTDFGLGSCQGHLALVPDPGSVIGIYAITSATCSVASVSQPQGGVTPTNATTVCCL